MTDISTPDAPLCSAPACGTRCVLSLRPEHCSNKAENEKSKESERGVRTANRMTEEHRKTGEEKKRAQRTRVVVMSDTRTFTAPEHTRAGRSDATPLTPGTPVLHVHSLPVMCVLLHQFGLYVDKLCQEISKWSNVVFAGSKKRPIRDQNMTSWVDR